MSQPGLYSEGRHVNNGGLVLENRKLKKELEFLWTFAEVAAESSRSSFVEKGVDSESEQGRAQVFGVEPKYRDYLEARKLKEERETPS